MPLPCLTHRRTARTIPDLSCDTPTPWSSPADRNRRFPSD